MLEPDRDDAESSPTLDPLAGYSTLADLASSEDVTKSLDGPPVPLPYADEIQTSFGRHDVSGVEAHVGGPAAKVSDALGAYAFATGKTVAFAEP